MSICNIINVSMDSMSILVSVGSLDFFMTCSLLMSILGVAMTIVDVVSKPVGLIVSMMIVVMFMVSMMMIVCQAACDADREKEEEEGLLHC